MLILRRHMKAPPLCLLAVPSLQARSHLTDVFCMSCKCAVVCVFNIETKAKITTKGKQRYILLPGGIDCNVMTHGKKRRK